jgi:hypothetical protein
MSMPADEIGGQTFVQEPRLKAPRTEANFTTKRRKTDMNRRKTPRAENSLMYE